MCEKTGIKILYEIQIFVMTDNTITTDKLIIALLTGAALGVVIGMLLAPEKGTELRKRISDIAENIADRLADFFSIEEQNLLQPAAGESSVTPDEILE